MSAFDRRLTPARPDLAAEHLRGSVEADRYAVGQKLRVIEEVVDLRAEPRRDRGIDTQVLFGEEITVYEIDEEGWAWGQASRDSYVGYLPASTLAKETAAPTHRVRAPRTFVYPVANMKEPVVMALPLGAEVAVASTRGDFAQVAGLGFVWADHLAPGGSAAPDFVAVAEFFLNAPYLWGGKTFAGLDCSGLVQVSQHASGRASPRDTDMMRAGLGGEIPVGEDLAGLRRGDLVFWKGHVGIMRDAAELLHANGHRMMVASEPLRVARDRIAAKSFGEIVCVRRL